MPSRRPNWWAPRYTRPERLCRRRALGDDLVFVDEGGAAIFHDNAAIDDHGHDIAALSGVHQRPDWVECRGQMGTPEVKQHHISLLADGQAAEIVVAAERLCRAERRHVKYV